MLEDLQRVMKVLNPEWKKIPPNQQELLIVHTIQFLDSAGNLFTLTELLKPLLTGSEEQWKIQKGCYLNQVPCSIIIGMFTQKEVLLHWVIMIFFQLNLHKKRNLSFKEKQIWGGIFRRQRCKYVTVGPILDSLFLFHMWEHTPF